MAEHTIAIGGRRQIISLLETSVVSPPHAVGFRTIRASVDPNGRGFTMLVGALAALPALSIDISAPTLVAVQADLGTSTPVTGLSLSLFMIGFASGQFGGGSWSDRHGRRPVLLAGLGLFAFAGLACSLAPDGIFLACSRFLQGLGAGACSVLAFAIVNDLFQGDAARRKRSYVTVVFGLAPIIAPALGVWISEIGGWRSVYLVLALAGAALATLVWAGVGETRPVMRRHNAASCATEMSLWSDHRFLSLVAVNALSYGAIFAYIAGSPIVVIGQLGQSAPTYAILFAGTAFALTAGAWTSARLAGRGLSATRLAAPALAIGAATAIALGVLAAIPTTPAIAAVPLLMVNLFCRGLVAPNVQHLASECRRAQAGVANAVIGVSQILVGAAASAAVSVLLLPLGPLAVGLCMAVLSAGAALVWALAVRPQVAAIPVE